MRGLVESGLELLWDTPGPTTNAIAIPLCATNARRVISKVVSLFHEFSATALIAGPKTTAGMQFVLACPSKVRRFCCLTANHRVLASASLQ